MNVLVYFFFLWNLKLKNIDFIKIWYNKLILFKKECWGIILCKIN